MDYLVRDITEMKLSMNIIDGYNGNVKDYCDRLIERIEKANIKKRRLYSLIESYKKTLDEQEELIKSMEESKERLMLLQNKKFPKFLLTGDIETSVQGPVIKEIRNLEISPRINNGCKATENYNPTSEGLLINNTFFDGCSSIANSTFRRNDVISMTPKARNDLEISVSYVTNQEFLQIPSYMKGRTTMDNINNFINIFNTTLNKKYELIKKVKKNKTKAELEQCLLWKEQDVGELKGSYFCTAEDFDNLGSIKLGNKKYLSIIMMLRHLKRIKEVRKVKVIYYVACF